jgi:hypothetical protein
VVDPAGGTFSPEGFTVSVQNATWAWAGAARISMAPIEAKAATIDIRRMLAPLVLIWTPGARPSAPIPCIRS